MWTVSKPTVEGWYWCRVWYAGELETSEHAVLWWDGSAWAGDPEFIDNEHFMYWTEALVAPRG